MPPLSTTEKEALESGTVGWDGELISGHPDWSKLFATRKPQLTAEEQAFLDGPVEELCRMLNTWDIQQKGDMPKEVWDFIKDNGFMGLEIPKQYGGKGFTSQAHSAVVIKIASRSSVAAVTVMVPNSLGPGELIKKYGTQEQKDYFLPRLANGTEVPCFALTGPDAGSDAGGMPDRGVVCKNAEGVLGLRLNWDKRYITLGPVATLIGLAFKMEDPDGLLGNKKDIGITVALIPRNTPGIEIGDRHLPMDMAFMNGPNKGKDVFIPIENIVGGPERAGEGWKMLMESLSVGRSLSLPAVSTACAKLATYASGSYSRVRRQFSMAVGKFEGVEEVLSRMAGLTYMMEAARSATVQMVDQGERPAIPSAILKYHLTENMRKIVNDAMDIHGGKAVSSGPNNVLADLYKSVPIGITVEGANILTRNLIIFGQGIVRAHPYALKEMEALNDNDDKSAFKKLRKLVAQHVFNTTKSAFKSVVYGITGRGGKSPVKDKATKKYYRQINRLSAAFNLAADTALGALGGDLKRKERLSARMGDVYSNLYLASCVLWHYEKQGCPKEDLPLVHWAVTHALHEAEQALDKALTNFPKESAFSFLPPFIARPLAAALKVALRPMIFPTGKHCAAPTDKMDRLAADCIRDPGPMRDKLSAGLFLPTTLNEPLGMLADAFRKSVAAEPLEKKIAIALRKGVLQEAASRGGLLEAALAKGVIQKDEMELIQQADAARNAVIMVDSFPQAKPAAPEKDSTFGALAPKI